MTLAGEVVELSDEVMNVGPFSVWDIAVPWPSHIPCDQSQQWWSSQVPCAWWFGVSESLLL